MALKTKEEIFNKIKEDLVALFELDEDDIHNILARVLLEFPVKQITVNFPDWVSSVSENHKLKSVLYNLVSLQKYFIDL